MRRLQSPGVGIEAALNSTAAHENSSQQPKGTPPIAILGFAVETGWGQDEAQQVRSVLAGTTALTPHTVPLYGELNHAPLTNSPWPPGQEPKPDPTPELALRLCRGALTMASLPGNFQTPDYPVPEVLVSVGCSKGLLRNLGLVRVPGDGYPPGPATHADLPGLIVAHQLGIHHPQVINYPAACATGLVALARSAAQLQDGLVDYALAGAVEYTAYPLALAGFRNMGALSSGYCRPFDESRSGFNTGDGGAMFLLARQNGQKPATQPLGWIRGWDTRSTSHHATAAEPGGHTLALSIRRTLAMAGWDPSDVEAINAHATGTEYNDLAEAAAIHQVFGHLTNPPTVFSFKGGIGHLLGASAAAELGLALLCARNQVLPGNPGLIQPDRQLPPICLPKQAQTSVPFRKILKLALGFGGPLATLALEVAPGNPVRFS